MKCLSVDDDPASLIRITALLSQFGDCDSASDAEQAINMVFAAATAGAPYDLIAIDIEMPRMTGIEMMAALAQAPSQFEISAVKKIIISGNSSRENVVAAVQSKCDGFLVKPITKALLEPKLLELGLITAAQPNTTS